MWQKLFFFLATMVVAGCSQEAIDKILNPPFLTGYGQDVGDDSMSSAADSVSGTLDTTAAVDNDSNGVTDDVPVVCPDPPPPFAEGKRVACMDYEPPIEPPVYCTVEKWLDCTWTCRKDNGDPLFYPVPAQYLMGWCQAGTP